jgi:hypothetical protein
VLTVQESLILVGLWEDLLVMGAVPGVVELIMGCRPRLTHLAVVAEVEIEIVIVAVEEHVLITVLL